MTPYEDVEREFVFELCNDTTARAIENYLRKNYPEAQWEVSFNKDKIVLKSTFFTPEERTFYTLKWT